METNTTKRGWHLQVRHGEWVKWGYDGPDGFLYLEPALDVIDDIRFTFEDLMPDPDKEGRPPQVHERRTAYGWRFQSDSRSQSTSWRLSETREQALEQARQSAERRVKQTMLEAMETVEEWEEF